MKRRSLIFFNLVVLLLLLGVNGLIYLKRNTGYAYSQALSYAQLYELKNDVRVTELINKPGDSLQLRLSGLPTGTRWKVGSYPQLDYESAAPTLRLLEGKHVYTLENLSVKMPQ